MPRISSVQLCAILLFCAIFPVMCDLDPQDGSAVEVAEPFPQLKCESLLVNCSCYDYEELVGIVCNNMTDYSNFSSYLSTDTIFEANMTYEITFSGIKYLPPRVLDGLIVFRLFLDDPELAAIDPLAFDGVLRLRRFHVRQSKIKVAPDFRTIHDSIRSINMDNSHLTSLEGEGFQDLPLVTRLSFVNNSISYIDPDVFKGTDSVIIFDVSYNLLTFIPPNLLNPWKKLSKFVVSYNKLFQMNQLFAVTHPRFIYVEYNNISDIGSLLQDNMTNVETIILSGNPLKKIDITFSEKIPLVRFVYLDHCHIREFNVTHFRNLNKLATLDLSYNVIEEVPKQTIDFGKNLELNLMGNQITRFDAEITFIVKRFYLNENKLSNLGSTLRFTQIVEVSVARNQIQYLSENDFRGVHAMANVELQGNRIRTIERKTFATITNYLHYLDLSSNLIQSLNGSIKYLSQLKLLNLTDNALRTFEEGEFTGLNELSELYLQHNQIVSLNGQLHQLPQLQFLVITHNNIETLSPEQIPKTPRYIYLAENPFKCDCRLLRFLLWLNTSNAPQTDVDLCLTPEEKSNTSLQSPAACPDECVCECTEDDNLHFMSVDCSSKNLTTVPLFLTDAVVKVEDYPSITFDFRRSLILEQNVYPRYNIHDSVLGINLDNNSLESLDSAKIPPEVINLYLSNNNLRRIDESTLYSLQNLKRATLSGNPWDCDCNTVGFKKWLLSKSDIIQDLNITRCGRNLNGESALDGRVISTLTDLDICPTDIAMYISLALGILAFLLLCTTAKILYSRNELDIKVFLYSHGMKWVKQRDLDHDKKFDAFISFSHKDMDFVDKEIVSVIENRDPNIRLCIHDRHFRPGEFIHANIQLAVQNSKRTVLILSRNFLESEWCLMEFRAADLQTQSDKEHRIILVKVGELPKKINPSIKAYLRTTTFLEWGDKYFWNKLLFALPTASRQRDPAPQNGTVIVKVEQGDTQLHI